MDELKKTSPEALFTPGESESGVVEAPTLLPEAPATPETAHEVPAAPETKPATRGDQAPPPPPPAPVAIKRAAPVAAAVAPKDELTREIEEILSEDLTDLFLKLDPKQKEMFKAKGEVTAEKIRGLVGHAKVSAKKVVDLIVDWLKLIPGVNRFFLEQEAKIKTDKILDAVEERRQKGQMSA